MSLDIITVGAKVIFRPQLPEDDEHSDLMGIVVPDINSAPELDTELQAIDVSNTEDYFTRYKLARQDPGGNAQFTLNHTDRIIELWQNGLTQLTRYGYKACYEYYYPEAQKSFFFAGETAMYQGTNSIEQNTLHTLPMNVAVRNTYGWHSRGNYGWGFSPNSTGTPENRYVASVSAGATTATLKIKAPGNFSECTAEVYTDLENNMVNSCSITDDPDLPEQTITVNLSTTKKIGAVLLKAYNSADDLVGEWAYYIIRKP